MPLDGALTKALDLLRERGSRLQKSDFLQALQWTEADWNPMREQLEQHARVEVTGQKRGTRYRWRDVRDQTDTRVINGESQDSE